MISNAGKLSCQDLLKKDVWNLAYAPVVAPVSAFALIKLFIMIGLFQLHRCDLDEGKCYAFCPRTAVDLSTLRKIYLTLPIWHRKLVRLKVIISHATDQKLREIAQHGGTVTALMELALAEGIIDSALFLPQWEYSASLSAS